MSLIALSEAWLARRRVAHRRVSALLAVALLLAACGGAPAASSTVAPSPAAKATEAGKPAATTASATTAAKPAATTASATAATKPVGPLAEKQELVAGISRNLVGGPENWLYSHTSLQVWEPLLNYDDELRLKPGLAERWTLSPDGLTWAFNLRKDVRFSDNTPFTADVAIANIQRWKQINGRPAEFLGGLNFPEIYGDPEKIAKVDDHTFIIAYKTPRPLLPYSIANHYSAIFAPNWDANGNFTGLPIGSGPYKLIDWKRDQYAILERNEAYWGTKPTLTKITLKYYPNANSRLSALKSGELDALVELGAILSAQARELRDDPNYVVAAHTSACSTHIAFNGTKAPFNDVRLRQAVSLAVDRQSFVKDLLYGYGTPAKGIMIAPNATFFNTDPAAQLRYDPAKAQALAKETLGGGRVKAVLAFNPPSEGITAWPYPQIAAYLQSIYRPLGIDLELKQMETAALTDARNNGDFDLALGNFCWATGDPNYILRRTLHSKAALNATQKGGFNNPEADKLLDQAVVEIEPVKQKALYDRVQVIGAEGLPIAPLFDQQTITAAKTHVRGLSQRIAYAPSFETVQLEKRL